MTDDYGAQNAAQTQAPGTGIAKPGYVTQSSSTEAGPMAHTDELAQIRVQEALNERVAREAKVPFKGPKMPPGLSPNEMVTMVTNGGVTIPPQTDQPQDEEEETELEPEAVGKKK